MDIGILADYLVVGVVAFCLAIGYVIKHSLQFIPNKYIPLILSVIGIAFNMWINDWIIAPEVIIGGIISGLASTGMYELFRNFIEGTTKEK